MLSLENQRRGGDALNLHVDLLVRDGADFARQQKSLAQKIAHERRRRVIVNFFRRADLFEHAEFHDRDPIGKTQRFDLIVGDENDRDVDPLLQGLSAPGASLRAVARRDCSAVHRAATLSARRPSARASATRCCWPPLSAGAGRSSRAGQPDKPKHVGDFFLGVAAL